MKVTLYPNIRHYSFHLLQTNIFSSLKKSFKAVRLYGCELALCKGNQITLFLSILKNLPFESTTPKLLDNLHIKVNISECLLSSDNGFQTHCTLESSENLYVILMPGSNPRCYDLGMKIFKSSLGDSNM